MKITIELEFYSLEQAKKKYRTHFGYDESHKVTKRDLGLWFSGLVQGDIDSVQEDESEQDEDY